ncbi:uncharacterized protein C8Q71DRAFT_771935 [Rhodofomes roseus]|uniref:CCHC-type domain-containing protein n=1 Tax=Rhodofomes roseus TaxID=34475 RepID=A0ABQ8K8R9_9APHY|nr:uncharacterized protein C8Q71DRAFT_771935 [Rhodofomes roseus]KAH9833653.1 hypothetical protein C8Q71DRAFT_771935 [Rhodofomes roseus]
MAYQFSRKGCFKCGNLGHIAENCTSEQRLCYNCRQPGHESSACPQPRSVAAKQCYSCGGVGHIQAECPSLRVQGSGQKCYVRPPSTQTCVIPIAHGRTVDASAISRGRAPMQAVRDSLPAPLPQAAP